MMYDLMILGAGPGGYHAAYTAVQYGMKTALVEKDLAGGTCLNRGCVPTKTLIHTADLFREIRHSEVFGIESADAKISREALLARKEEITASLRKGLEDSFKARKIDYLTGKGTVIDAHHVRVNGEIHETKYLLIASGSVPALPPIEGIGSSSVLTSDDILRDLPALTSLIVIGGGVIGTEIAGVYASLGTKVTILEAMDQLLPNMDAEIARNLSVIFKKRGIETHTSAMVQKIADTETGAEVTYTEKGKTVSVTADRVLVATGRKAYLEGLFENEMPELERGRIKISERMETSVPGIYAIGDVTFGYAQLAHMASAMGENAVRAMNGDGPSRDLKAVPACVYTSPEIAQAGMTEKEAKALGIETVIGKAPMHANARTKIAESERGFVKLVADKTNGKLLGAAMMCERATDMIMETVYGILDGKTPDELLEAVHPHPSFAEGIETALRVLKEKYR
ncbi:MAG: dihydrolipoyl dehydrogenase [Erysipelotrichales bacterium]|nr:dihydrolipoyl dehydrogenase [Erysipelotrichales bacterium]